MKRLAAVIVMLIALSSLLVGGTAGAALIPSTRTPLLSQAVPVAPLVGAVPVSREDDNDAVALPFPGSFAAYGTGTPIYADALEAAGKRLADVEVAFSGASFASQPMPGGLLNEMKRLVAPALAAHSGFGRGSGFELGLGIGKGERNQVILADLAESAAPPAAARITKQIGPVQIDPILKATLLRGQAQARASSGCTLGSDLAYGLGYAADLNMLDLAGGHDFLKALVKTSAPGPERSVSQSTSRTRLVPPADGRGPGMRFGLLSETRQTIAPVTFFAGTEHQFTVEVLGEWVLRGLADGKKGSIFYGPADKSPETPIVRILNGAGKTMSQLTFQDFLGQKGLEINIPGLAEIVIGEDPRAVGGDAASHATETGTAVRGAVDVVRVRLLSGSEGHLADVRLGHMEVGLTVPAGGIECSGIGMALRADPAKVKPGDSFDWVLTVSNPNDCKLTHVKVVDSVTATDGVKGEAVGSDPKADSLSASEITFNDIGPLGPGQSKDVRIRMKVSDRSADGRFTDHAVATGLCGPAAAEGDAATASEAEGDGVPMAGDITLQAPEVGMIRPIAMVKRAEPSTVNVGEPFTWIIKVSNPNDCVLSKLRIVDTVTATPGVIADVVSTEPKADGVDTAPVRVTFADIGRLKPGESRDLQIRMKVAERSGAGHFTDDAVATGVCGPASAEGEASSSGVVEAAKVLAESAGTVRLEGPDVNLPVTVAGQNLIAGTVPPGVEKPRSATGVQLPRTGGTADPLWALGLLGAGAMLRLLTRRRSAHSD